MAQKKITDLQLISAITDGLNFPLDNGIQSYRATSTQIRDYIASYLLGNNMIPATAIQSAAQFKINHIVNGNFDFWQRNFTSVSVSATNTYTCDRFVGLMNGSTSVVSRQSTDYSEPFQARNFARVTVSSVANAANFNSIATRLENVRNYANKTMTLSFWAKADASKSISVEFIQNFGTSGSPSADVNTLGVTKLSLTTSWQKFTVTVALPSISGKTIGTDLNSYLSVNIWFDAGSSFNTRTSSLGQQSGVFDIAQMKLEDGSIATQFALAGNNIGGELIACQRFYEKSYDPETNPGVATITGSTGYIFNNNGTTFTMFHEVYYKARKRAAGTIVFYNAATGGTGTWQATSPAENYTATLLASNANSVVVNLASVVGGRLLRGHYTCDSEL